MRTEIYPCDAGSMDLRVSSRRMGDPVESPLCSGRGELASPDGVNLQLMGGGAERTHH